MKVFDLKYYQCACKTIYLNPTISENNLMKYIKIMEFMKNIENKYCMKKKQSY